MKKDKREKLLLSMNLIDEEYVEEANIKKTKQPFHWRKFAAIAACVAVALTAVGVGVGWGVLQQPDEEHIPEHLVAYADSEYFSVIRKLDAYYSEQTGSTEDHFLSKDPVDESGTDYGITDNQVKGVTEADLIKRSDRYIFYLTNQALNVYSIAGEDSEQVGTYHLTPSVADTMKSAEKMKVCDAEFYLSEDFKTATIISVWFYADRKGFGTDIVLLDVSDPTNIVEKKTVHLDSGYISSRLVDGTLLWIGSYTPKSTIDYADVTTFIPQIQTEEGCVSIPMDGIIVPDELTSATYIVLCMLDQDTLTIQDSAAFLSYSSDVYVSRQTVYATRTYSNVLTKDTVTTTTIMTEISGVSYQKNALNWIGSVSIAGSVKDQYSLDEYDGILRAVTTTEVAKAGNYEGGSRFQSSHTNASLYCIDLSKWTVVAKVKDFAPEGESVQSVRFNGDAAYVCTAEVITISDPVFFFDLSDLDHITYTDTGTIQGYSTSLISFGDGYLVGIGVGDTRDSVKLEVYRESKDGVVSVCSYQVDHAWYITDYKSYLIDRENQLIGLGIYEMNYEPDITNYFLFSYHEGNLTPVIKTRIKDNIYNLESIRAVYIDGYLYVLSGEQFEVVPVDLTETAQ